MSTTSDAIDLDAIEAAAKKQGIGFIGTDVRLLLGLVSEVRSLSEQRDWCLREIERLVDEVHDLRTVRRAAASGETRT